jgi:hypothetical protein
MNRLSGFKSIYDFCFCPLDYRGRNSQTKRQKILSFKLKLLLWVETKFTRVVEARTTEFLTEIKKREFFCDDQ